PRPRGRLHALDGQADRRPLRLDARDGRRAGRLLEGPPRPPSAPTPTYRAAARLATGRGPTPRRAEGRGTAPLDVLAPPAPDGHRGGGPGAVGLHRLPLPEPDPGGARLGPRRDRLRTRLPALDTDLPDRRQRPERRRDAGRRRDPHRDPGREADGPERAR